MFKKIIIMGLPGSGKTTLAKNIIQALGHVSLSWHNADSVRQRYDDWDFSPQGRLRQAQRMGEMVRRDAEQGMVSIADFVCPTEETRISFDTSSADLVIWMDTIHSSRYEDTNQLWQMPSHYHLRIRTFNDQWGSVVAGMIQNSQLPQQWDNRGPTTQMLGRWQPWHDGHQALFERLLERTGQVAIQIRDCEGWNDSNPFDVISVEHNIHQRLETAYYGRYQVLVVPNIVHIGYGRGVGYTMAQETFDDATHAISATNIRKHMGLE